MSDNRLWLVGEFIAEEPSGNVWDFCGVFDSASRARAECLRRGSRHFMAPVYLNDESIPRDTRDFPECVYPEIGGKA